MTCSECGGEIRLGDYPLCHGDPAKHERMSGGFLGNAKRFDPVVVFRNPVTGQISVPGRNDDPTPHGYQRVVADDIRKVRQIERELRTRSSAERDAEIEKRGVVYGGYKLKPETEIIKERREVLRDKMQGFSPQGRQFAEYCMKRADDERAKKAARTRSADIGGGFEAFNQNRSNRLEHNDPETGKRDRG